MQITLNFKVRPATLRDVTDIALLAKQLVKETGVLKRQGYEASKVVQIAERFVEDDNMSLFVAEVDGMVVGFIAGMLVPTFFSHENQVAEMGFFVESDYRNSGIALALHKEYEAWAVSKEPRIVTMMHMENEYAPRIAKMYEKMGYDKYETAYVKEIK